MKLNLKSLALCAAMLSFGFATDIQVQIHEIQIPYGTTLINTNFLMINNTFVKQFKDIVKTKSADLAEKSLKEALIKEPNISVNHRNLEVVFNKPVPEFCYYEFEGNYGNFNFYGYMGTRNSMHFSLYPKSFGKFEDVAKENSEHFKDILHVDYYSAAISNITNNISGIIDINANKEEIEKFKITNEEIIGIICNILQEFLERDTNGNSFDKITKYCTPVDFIDNVNSLKFDLQLRSLKQTIRLFYFVTPDNEQKSFLELLYRIILDPVLSEQLYRQ